jgi:cell wall-associated NlpC family hydrolase
VTAPDPGTVAAQAITAAAAANTSTTVGGLPAPSLEQAQANVLTNVTPLDPPPMKTLVYSPEVRIIIAHGTKQYDVSNDVVAFSVRRVENGVSSAAFRLSNKALPNDQTKLRYNQLFERMDRVLIYLKRSEWVMAFSGYLDRVPFVQLYPGTVEFRASCTLKRLQHTWWDPGLNSARDIFDQPARAQEEQANGEISTDRGLGSLLRRLLVKVGGWQPDHVHIQRFPAGFYDFMEQQLRRLSPGAESAVQDFKELLLGEGDTSLGPGRSASRQQGVTMGGYVVGKEERMLEVIRAVDEMGMGVDTTSLAAAQGVAIAGTGGTDQRDQQGWKAFQELGKNWQDAALKNDAAVHCFMTIMTESSFRMLANKAIPESLGYPNDGTGPDGTSVGLYQQQNFGEWGSLSQRMNVKASTQMFLQHLNRLGWRNMDRAAACQAVQRSSFSDGRNYKAWEDWAIEQVRAVRSGTGTAQGSGGQSNVGSTSVTGGVTLANGITPPAPGTIGTVVPGVPTVNGTTGATAAASLAGQPLYNTAGALSCATSRIGSPYEWGAQGPGKFDCAGLMRFAYRSIGVEIGEGTSTQKANGQKIPFGNLVPGDLIFPAEYDHVVMYAGGNMMIDAPDVGQTVQLKPINFDVQAAECRHIAGTEYGGSPVAPFDIARAMSGNNAAAGTATTGLNGSTGTGQTEPIARNLFTFSFFAGQFTNSISNAFGGQVGSEEKAFINDEPLLQTVVSFAAAGLRNFQSAPNGDFIAYYPDYFGLEGTEAVWNLEDIEMKNVQIDFNDDALTTHVYVAGSMDPRAGNQGVPGWLRSKGVATVENEWLFRRMTAATPHLPGEFLQSGKQIMQRFGARPLVRSMSSIAEGPMEFLCAVQLFMLKWAEQYSTVIETTFMPGVFPGMRLNLVKHNLQVYVSEVTHSGDFESGFTTSMTIMAPSNPAVMKLQTSVFDANAAEAASRRDMVNNETQVVG